MENERNNSTTSAVSAGPTPGIESGRLCRALEPHPIASMFPRPDAETFMKLKQDIARNGQRQPILTHRGKILDGLSRFQACEELGLEPLTQEWDGRGSLEALVASLNLHRRHLTSSQRAALVVDIERLTEEAQNAAPPPEGPPDPATPAAATAEAALPQILGEEPARRGKHAGEAAEKLAKRAGTNRQYVTDAKKLRKEAPDLLQEVRERKKTMPQAKKEFTRRRKEAELAEKAKTAKAEAAPAHSPWELLRGDNLDVLPKLAAEGRTFRLAFLDPPANDGTDYGDGRQADFRPDPQYLGWCREWLRLCARVLAPDASLWLLTSGNYADRLALMLTELGLHRRRWIAWSGGRVERRADNFGLSLRHLLYYVKDPLRFVFNPPTVQGEFPGGAADRSSPRDDLWLMPALTDASPERLPEVPAQLPLALPRAIVRACSNPGDEVLDPFAGGAGMGVAAVEAGRRYLGVEVQARYCELARLRLEAVRSPGVEGQAPGPTVTATAVVEPDGDPPGGAAG